MDMKDAFSVKDFLQRDATFDGALAAVKVRDGGIGRRYSVKAACFARLRAWPEANLAKRELL